MDLIREILASHESGISRDGLLAWARLRGNPQMTDEELESALAAMGDEVVDVQGFLYLRRFAAPGATRDAAPPPPPPPAPPAAWSAPAETTPGQVGAGTEPVAAGVAGAGAGIPSWVPPDAPAAAPPDGGAWPPPDQPAWGEPDQPAWPTSAQAGSGRRSMIVAAAGVGIFLAISLGVSLVLRDDDAAAETPALPTPTAGTVVGAESLAVGNCIVVPSEDEFDEVRTLACTEMHDGEVFFVGDHPDGDFPTDEAFEAFVDEQCLPAFTTYTGSDFYEQDVLDVGWFVPTESAWGRGDREIVCHLTPIDGTQTDRSWQGGNP